MHECSRCQEWYWQSCSLGQIALPADNLRQQDISDTRNKYDFNHPPSTLHLLHVSATARVLSRMNAFRDWYMTVFLRREAFRRVVKAIAQSLVSWTSFGAAPMTWVLSQVYGLDCVQQCSAMSLL